jgi:hypothetical protein
MDGPGREPWIAFTETFGSIPMSNDLRGKVSLAIAGYASLISGLRLTNRLQPMSAFGRLRTSAKSASDPKRTD